MKKRAKPVAPPRPFRRIAVLKGGPSSEREVSLRSGAAVANGLREAGYEVVEVDVTKARVALPAGIDAVFIALHGAYGEDGGVQADLEKRGVPYAGSNPQASRVAFDKRLTKAAFDAAGIATPAWEVLSDPAARKLPLPVVLKPPCQGSSIGIHRVFRHAEWAAAFADAIQYDGEVLVEDYLPGRELTVGILGDEALPVVEIRAPRGNYDYVSKYTKGRTCYLVPAPLSVSETRQAQMLGLAAFRVLGCAGFGRTDIRLDPRGRMGVLEVNTIPGFTETSLLPKAAAIAGYTFSELCDRILRFAAVTGR
ncbi:MAG: D-alanine--D-alanine ligase [bacterium]